ncbi:MAG: response regulator transcription factor [Verrucomicrobium sp.]
MSPAHPIHVAIVDDDESICRALGRLFRAAGFQSTGYLSAEAFLTDAAPPSYDCLVLDVQLGGMSGIELMRRLVHAGNQVPVIFITAFDDAMAREEALAAGCAAYFLKTDTGDEVLAAIRLASAQPKPGERLSIPGVSDRKGGVAGISEQPSSKFGNRDDS